MQPAGRSNSRNIIMFIFTCISSSLKSSVTHTCSETFQSEHVHRDQAPVDEAAFQRHGSHSANCFTLARFVEASLQQNQDESLQVSTETPAKYRKAKNTSLHLWLIRRYLTGRCRVASIFYLIDYQICWSLFSTKYGAFSPQNVVIVIHKT